MTCQSICDACDTVRHCSQHGCVPVTHVGLFEGLAASAAMGTPINFPQPPKGQTMNHTNFHLAQGFSANQATKPQPAELTVVETEFGRLRDAMVSLGLTMNEHATRLAPVLLPYGAPTGEQVEEAERDIGQIGNDLRQMRKQVEAVLAQFSDLRFRLTI